MKKISMALALLVFAILLVGAERSLDNKLPPTVEPLTTEPILCEPAPVNLNADESGKFISVLPGWGSHSYQVTTTNDSAQFYFNQALNFYFSYHFREALASFKESARFDKSCAMAYWGQALAMGPYFNNYFYKMNKEVPGVLEQMNHALEATSPKEKALVSAMNKRYSANTTNSDRRQLDSNYANSMLLLTRQFPADDDIKALYVDAMMLAHKWDFWHNDGNPKSWTPELVTICESILTRDPVHPAALHYLIHVTEASKHPEKALHSADVLKETLPGVGHMVHMATHMYQRNGLYAKGVYVNEDANTAINQTDSLIPYIGIGRNTNLHIFAVQSYCAMNAGMFTMGMPVYLRARNRLVALRSSIEKDAYSQYVYMMPVIAWVRLGKWQEILASPAPDAGWKYSVALDDFAKGMAHVRNNDLAKAHILLSNLQVGMIDSLLFVRLMPFNKPVQCLRIAEGILRGEILYAQGKTSEAIKAFKLAVAEEDQLIYCEPKDWLIPSRQYLGACLLKMKRATEAEKVFREDLVNNPGNGWSLMGMHQSMLAQKKTKEAAEYKVAFDSAFTAADVKLKSSVL
ncbi:MAG: hypothetical protein WKF89_07530 [Chitinophagaceae bacterium]